MSGRKPIVIHRARPLEGELPWFEYQGERYRITGGGPGTPNAQDGYEIHDWSYRRSMDGFHTLDDIRKLLAQAQREQWETLWEDVPLYGADERLDAASQAEIWKQGFAAGRRSAYIGHFDQYDTGSLMFKQATNPYDQELQNASY